MADFNKVNEIATEDAAEALHELSDEDFINVIAELVHRRTNNFKEVNTILNTIVSKISTSFTIIS